MGKFIVQVEETTYHSLVVEAESAEHASWRVAQDGFEAGYETKFYSEGLKLREVVKICEEVDNV